MVGGGSYPQSTGLGLLLVGPIRLDYGLGPGWVYSSVIAVKP